MKGSRISLLVLFMIGTLCITAFWEVPYEPGKLEATGKTADGKTVSVAVQTAGEPAKITLSPDKKVLKANRQDLSYVTAQVVDANNIPVPFGDNMISFEVKVQENFPQLVTAISKVIHS